MKQKHTNKMVDSCICEINKIFKQVHEEFTSGKVTAPQAKGLLKKRVEPILNETASGGYDDMLEILVGISEDSAKEFDRANIRGQVKQPLQAKESYYVDAKILEAFEDDDSAFTLEELPEQEFTSSKTSMNSSKLPIIFKLVRFSPDTTNLDYGGGKFDNATEYLESLGVTNLIFDPFNRTSEHNATVVKTIKNDGGADTATCSNVLNVIKEPEVRRSVLKRIKAYLKPNGVAYFTVYEGSRLSDSGETKAGYQLNIKTEEYVDEILREFSNVYRKGRLIVATN